jgi:uncharacterized protein (DUF2267 family)
LYYEAWRPAGKPEKIRSREEFVARIAKELANARPIDPDDAARAVFQVLGSHVAPGEIRQVMHVLAEEIRALWPRSWVGVP